MLSKRQWQLLLPIPLIPYIHQSHRIKGKHTTFLLCALANLFCSNLEKIRSLEWLCLNNQSQEALEYSNSLVCQLILNGHIDDANKVRYPFFKKGIECDFAQAMMMVQSNLNQQFMEDYQQVLKLSLDVASTL
jgi:hypothetical protein